MNTGLEVQTTTEEKESNIILRSLPEFENAGNVLLTNKGRADKATAVGRKILADLKEAGGVMTPEMDQRMNNFLVNCAKANKEMNESRKVFTQMLDLIKKAFTSEENRLDKDNAATEAYQIQQIRNAYAKQLAKEEQERQARIKAEQELEAEKIALKAENKTRLIAYVGELMKAANRSLEASFNGIELDTFEEKSKKLNDFTPILAHKHYAMFQHGLYSRLLVKADIDELVQPDIDAMYEEQANRFVSYLLESKQYLIDRLPSKKKELEAIKEMEEEAERERIAAEELQKQIDAQNNEKERQRLQEEQRIANEKAAQAAKDKADAEEARRQREADEAAKAAAAIEAQSEAATEAVNIESNIAQTMSLFGAEAAISEQAVATPQARAGYEIEVLTPVGYMALFEKWFKLEGQTMTLDQLDKKLDFTRKYCEKIAHKDENQKIQSSTLRYNQVFTAVNKKK